MIKEYTGTGKTVEEATLAAKAGLNAPDLADLKVDVIQFPKKKILGLFGGSEAKVRVSYDDGVKEKKNKKQNSKRKNNAKNNGQKPQAKKQPAPKKAAEPKKEEKEEVKREYPKTVDLEYAKGYLAEIIKGLKVEDAKLDASYSEGVITIEISCEDYGIIIGRRGETLDSIQYLLSLAMKKHSDAYVRVSINVGNYREKRNETLKHLARKNSSYVLRTGRRYTFEPMNPYERRIIHTAVQEIEGVESRSIGYNQDRRVVIEPIGGVKFQRGARRGGAKPAATTAAPENYTPKADRADLPKFGKIEVNND